MSVYLHEKRKTSRHLFWRLCWQTAGAVGVFFVVVALFRLSAPEAVPMKDAVRACFTSDVDVTPVMEWFQAEVYETVPEQDDSDGTITDAVQTIAPGH